MRSGPAGVCSRSAPARPWTSRTGTSRSPSAALAAASIGLRLDSGAVAIRANHSSDVTSSGLVVARCPRIVSCSTTGTRLCCSADRHSCTPRRRERVMALERVARHSPEGLAPVDAGKTRQVRRHHVRPRREGRIRRHIPGSRGHRPPSGDTLDRTPQNPNPPIGA